jgi:hypothetical protein
VDSASGTARAVHQLQLDVTVNAGDVTINATALAGLTTRVTATEGSITTIAQDVVNLNAGLTTAEGNIVAQADAATILTAKVTDNEGVITAHASSITTLSTTVGANTASITTQATTIDGIMAEQTIALDVNGHISGLILRAEIGVSGAVVSTAAFVADKFAIVGPGATPETPFIVYTTPQVIGGKTVPAGVYMKTAFIHDGFINSAMIGDAQIGRAQVTDVIKSDDYAQDGNGNPTVGLKLNFKTGKIKAAGNVISRPTEFATGDFDPGVVAVDPFTGLYLVQSWDLVETGVLVPVNQVWMASNKSYLAYAAFEGGATAPSGISGDNEFWGCQCILQPFARWNGPQQLYLRVELWAKGITALHKAGNAGLPGRIHWTLYQVT